MWECISRTLTRLPELWKVWRSRRQSDTWKMSSNTRHAFHSEDTPVMVVEPHKLQFTELPSVDTPRNQPDTFTPSSRTLLPTLKPRVLMLRNALFPTLPWTEPSKVEEEPSELTVESGHTCLQTVTLNSSSLKRPRTSRSLLKTRTSLDSPRSKQPNKDSPSENELLSCFVASTMCSTQSISLLNY